MPPATTSFSSAQNLLRGGQPRKLGKLVHEPLDRCRFLENRLRAFPDDFIDRALQRRAVRLAKNSLGGKRDRRQRILISCATRRATLKTNCI